MNNFIGTLKPLQITINTCCIAHRRINWNIVILLRPSDGIRYKYLYAAFVLVVPSLICSFRIMIQQSCEFLIISIMTLTQWAIQRVLQINIFVNTLGEPLQSLNSISTIGVGYLLTDGLNQRIVKGIRIHSWPAKFGLSTCTHL